MTERPTQKAQRLDYKLLRSLESKVPDYVPDRDGEILIDCLFLTETEVAVEQGLHRRTIQEIKKKHRAAYESMKECKGAVVASGNLDNAYLVMKKNREFLLSDKCTVGSVQEASLLASVGTQAAKSAISFSDSGSQADQQPPKTLLAKIVDLEPK